MRSIVVSFLVRRQQNARAADQCRRRIEEILKASKNLRPVTEGTIFCTTKATPLVQLGGGVELDPCSSRPEPPSVLRARADCGGRLFTAKLGVVVHICRINCSITCWRMTPSCWLVSSATVFAIASYDSHACLSCPKAGGWGLLPAGETVARSTWRTRCRAILFQRVCRRHLYIGASV